MSANFFDTTIGEQLTLQRGFDITKKQQAPGEVPVVSSGGISSHHNEAKVEAPGVVLGRKGSLGTVFFLEQDFWPHDTTLWVKNFKNNNPRYVYYFFLSISDQLKKMDVGAANPALNRNHVHPIEIRWPRRHIQDKSVEVLSALDKKIQLNNQINQTLEQMAQAIFKSWFVDFEPVKAKIATLEAGGSEHDALLAAMQAISGKDEAALAQLETEQPEQYAELQATAELFPSAMQDSELGEIPEGWETSEIGNEVTVVGGGTPSTKKPEFWEGGDIHWTTPKDLSNLPNKVLLDTERKVTPEGLAKISSGLLPVDTVLMSSRAPVGYLALAKIPVAVNQGYIAMKCERRLSPEFVIQWCSANMAEIKSRASGTTFAEISKKNFKVIPSLVPSAGLMTAYTAIVKKLYAEVEVKARESVTLAQLRDMLLPKLLSGELSLEGIETGEVATA